MTRPDYKRFADDVLCKLPRFDDTLALYIDELAHKCGIFEDHEMVEPIGFDGWYRVEDEPPPIGERILVVTNGKVVCDERLSGELMEDGKIMWLISANVLPYSPTHWRYLPEPPKEGEG